jgi:hypothetical protein
MTEYVKPEQDWRAVQGAVRLAGELAILAEGVMIWAKSSCATFMGTLLESASIVSGVSSARSQDKSWL